MQLLAMKSRHMPRQAHAYLGTWRISPDLLSKGPPVYLFIDYERETCDSL